MYGLWFLKWEKSNINNYELQVWKIDQVALKLFWEYSWDGKSNEDWEWNLFFTKEKLNLTLGKRTEKQLASYEHYKYKI